MKTYTDHDGKEWVMGQRNSELAQDLYADLVAAINIATQLQAEVKRLNEAYFQQGREVNRLNNQLRNAEGACVDAGTFCNGPSDLVNAIGRIRAFRWDIA